jgi:hypothetical protein
VFDFACGSGSLILNVRKQMGEYGVSKIFAQEKNITTYNLARMNMLNYIILILESNKRMKDGLCYFVTCIGILLPGPDWVK